MIHKRVAILISGSGSNMMTLIDSMVGEHAGRPCLVISNNADAAGLGKAAANGVEAAVVDHRPHKGNRAAFEDQLHARLAQSQPDILCLAGFMRILTPDFIARWQGRMLNIHPSLLPKYTGLHTHQRVFDAGEKQHGCTVHEVTGELDMGPLRGQAEIDVTAGDTPDTLAERILVQEHRLYPAVLKRFAAGDMTPVYLRG